MEKCLAAECDKMKRSLFLTISNKFDKIMKAVDYRAELPEKTQAWRELGKDLPFDNLELFLKFEEDLNTEVDKKNTLVRLFFTIKY